MKQKLLILWAFLLTSLGAMAQTDVTDLYLTNAGFDDETSFVSSTIYTYANDANTYGGVSSCQSVTGWTADATGDGKAGGAMQYGCGYGLSGTGYICPTSDANGNTSGGVLALAGCWNNSAGYSQSLTLPAGFYRISYKVYNAGTNIIANYTNTIGFEESNGTTHYADMEFYTDEWTEGMIYLSLAQETSGTMHVGYTCANVGSGASPKLFLDYIKIEAYNAAQNYTLVDKTSLVGTANSDWGCSNNNYTAESVSASEKYQWAASLATGEQNSQTVSSLPNGTYQVSAYVGVSSTSGRDNTSNVVTDYATTYVSFHANSASHGVPAYNRTSFSKFDRIELNDVTVTDGTLKLYLNEDVAGPNWLTAQIKKLLYLNTSDAVAVSYGAFSLPSTAVTAGYWYQVAVPVAGDYTLTPGSSATISYTQDGTALTSASFSTTTGGTLSLLAGTLYVKSSAAVTLTLTAANYGYEVGSATVDKTYVQGGETITVSYPDAVTNDPNGTLTITTSNIKFNDTTVTATATSNGFTFTVPTVSAASSYLLSIPAGAAKYGSNASSAAQTITIYTPAVFDGTYYLYNEAGQYLSRGNNWGTHAIADDWGLPLNVATDGDGHTTFQFIDSGKYLYASGTNAWSDGTDPTNANTQWTATLYNGKYRLSSAIAATTYVKMDSGDTNLYIDGSDDSVIQNWTFELPSAHPAKMEALRTAAKALSSQVSGLSSKTYVEAATSTTAEEYQGTSYFAGSSIVSGSLAVYPGIYKFSVPAFHRMGNNDVTLPMHEAGTECPPVFAYFGDAKVQLHSVYDATTEQADKTYTPDDVNYYPNDQATSLTAFQAGSYVNEIWVEVTEATTLNYGIANQSSLSMAGRWTCYASNGIEITRYYDPSTASLSDGDDVTSLIQNPTIESTDVRARPNGWSGTTSSWDWTKATGDTFMECWNGSAASVNFNMYQTINGLQEGVYELSADMFNSSNSEDLAAAFTGGECGLYATTASAHAFVGVTTDSNSDAMSNYTLYIYVNEGESLTLGVKNMATPTGRWFGCDNFTLKYRTLDAASSLLIASIPTSQANSSLKSAMNSANMNLSSATTKTGDLFNALTSAIADVRVSAANYGHLLYALDTDDSRLAATPSAVQTEYAAVKSDLRAYYTNQTATGDCTTEIAIVKASLAQALINTGESLTYLIVNNSFETGDLTGWNVTAGDDTGVKTNGGSTYGTDGGDGTYLFNTWSKGDKGGNPLRQNIGYLPAGTYKLTSLVTTSAGTIFLLVNDYVSSGTTSNDKTTFLSAAITVTLDDVTEVTIGVAGGDGEQYTGSNGCWYKADDFQLNAVEQQGGGGEEEDDVMISTNSYYARGSQNIFGRFAVKGSSTAVTEQGLCYSATNKEPTVGDSKSTDYISYCGKIFKISGLTPATAYYVRPYATIDGNLYYGEVHKVYTLPTGSITYGIRSSDNSTYDTNITNAIKTWAEYWNKYTCISGYYSNAGYVSGVATADCSYGGYIRFGSNTSYQQCGTAMHENLHGIGMGTTSEWTSLGSGKTWAGPRVNEFIKFFENSDGATMYGDSQHAWCSNSNGGLSYTINGAHEDAYSDLQRTANSLLAQAYTEDGLRPTSGAYYFTPYYSIEQEDDDVFYIQNSSNGKYLVDSNGTLGAQAYASLDDAKTAGIAAWKLTFDPDTRWYHLTSVKHGNNLSHANYAWGINKEDANLLIVKSVNEGKYYINTPTTNGRNLLGNLSCGTTSPVDTSNANGQDWVFYREQPEVEVIYGDINKDNKVSISDLTCLIDILLGNNSDPNYDYKAANVNKDSGITGSDIRALYNILLGK